MKKSEGAPSTTDRFKQAEECDQARRDAVDRLRGLSNDSPGQEADKVGQDYDDADAMREWYLAQAGREFRGNCIQRIARTVLARFQWRQ